MQSRVWNTFLEFRGDADLEQAKGESSRRSLSMGAVRAGPCATSLAAASPSCYRTDWTPWSMPTAGPIAKSLKMLDDSSPSTAASIGSEMEEPMSARRRSTGQGKGDFIEREETLSTNDSGENSDSGTGSGSGHGSNLNLSIWAGEVLASGEEQQRELSGTSLSAGQECEADTSFMSSPQERAKNSPKGWKGRVKGNKTISLIVSNLNCRCSADCLMSCLNDLGLDGCYASVYVPSRCVKGKFSANFGYGFILCKGSSSALTVRTKPV